MTFSRVSPRSTGERLGRTGMTACPAGPSSICARLAGLAALALDLADVEHLLLPGAVAVDGDPLDPQLVGQQVDALDILGAGLVGEVDGLGDRVVDVVLEGRLHADMPLGRHVVGGHEHLLEIVGHVHVVEPAHRGDALHQLVRVEAPLLQHPLEAPDGPRATRCCP